MLRDGIGIGVLQAKAASFRHCRILMLVHQDNPLERGVGIGGDDSPTCQLPGGWSFNPLGSGIGIGGVFLIR